MNPRRNKTTAKKKGIRVTRAALEPPTAAPRIIVINVVRLYLKSTIVGPRRPYKIELNGSPKTIAPSILQLPSPGMVLNSVAAESI
jgi:hypothetical protein